MTFTLTLKSDVRLTVSHVTLSLALSVRQVMFNSSPAITVELSVVKETTGVTAEVKNCVHGLICITIIIGR